MAWRVAAVFATLGAISACGGGGGSDSAAAPAAPSPPEYAGTRLSLAQLPASCAQSTCVPFVSATVDTAGEASFFWTEAAPGATPRLRAANHSAGSASLQGSGDIASGYNTAAITPSFAVRPVSARRFVVWQADMPAGGPSSLDIPMHSRVVNFAASAAPSVGPLTAVPSALWSINGSEYPFPTTVRDSTGALYAFASDPLADTVVPLGDGLNLTVAPTPTLPLANPETGVLVEYTESIAPRAMWAMYGSASAGAPRQMVLADVSLPTGTVLPPTTVSTQTFSPGAGSVGCAYTPPMRVRASVTAVIQQVVAWAQLNAAGTGCDLMVNGTKVSGAGDARPYEVSVSGSEIVAVWAECGSGICHIYWSRKPLSAIPSPTDTWSAPAMIASNHVLPTDMQTLSMATSGPNGTLLLAWSNSQYVSPGLFSGDGSWRVSKYANGAWTTVKFSAYETIRALSINGAGQGTALVTRATCGAAACEDLAAYRF